MALSPLPPFWAGYLMVLTALLGLVMGSALHCLSWRIAREEGWGSGRSRCAACGHTLGPGELIPLVSWLLQKGRCRHCGAPISWRYPASELTLAVVYVSLLLRFGITLELAQNLVLCSCLFCLSIVDLDVQLIPHRFLLIPALVRLGLCAWQEGLTQTGICLVRGAALGAVILLLVMLLDKVLGKPSMGGGDIKLLAMLGLFFPLMNWLLMVMLACVLGIAVALACGTKRGVAFPFGPAIAGAAWLTLLFGQEICSWYLGLF